MAWIIAAAIATTCIFLARTVWIRRWTLFAVSDQAKLTERTITVGLLLQGVALFLKSPLSAHTVGWALHAATGQWNLDTWAGDCCYIGAAGLIGANAGSRLNRTNDQLRAGFRQHFELPMTIIAPLLLAFLTMSPNASSDHPDMYDCQTDYWLDLYWTLLCSFIAYTLYQTTTALHILRAEARNKRTAAIYITACWCAITDCALRIITTWTDDDYDQWFWIGNCFVAVAFAYAAGQSWQKKVQWMRPPRAHRL